jgi:hypothetical protein
MMIPIIEIHYLLRVVVIFIKYDKIIALVFGNNRSDNRNLIPLKI